LRERKEDVEPLLNHFVSEFSVRMNKPHLKIDKNLVGILKKYQFPGNVRELKNMTERAVILSKGELLTATGFPVKNKQRSSAGNGSELGTIQEQGSAFTPAGPENHGYNQKAAAEALGITRDSFIRRMKKHNIKIKKED